ncbi:putative esterase [Marinobacterium lacunae]|uniref:Putative esterase n=1 Tax=Marinobacterium lacunae TaxID=1232683 RepID=A0A081G2C5_9GAMM|nr:YqiA/YcfP family alpha/beta fold hydrolase [Marinobacterium lacunae]KEA64930.1 putative esterase [Marinobacterium lacunae]MBR9882260.1 alpha/beta fold hydrolase [Oceanospirillales bacterium]
MSNTAYIYVHGFNSSPSSWKAQVLGKALHERGLAGQFICPELSHWPERAIRQLDALIAQQSELQRDIVLIGSSLGGYYSSYLVERAVARGERLRAVLVNPAVYPYRLLEEWLGENQNLYTAERYELTRRHLEQLLALDTGVPAEPERYLLLVQTGDETLDYREAVDKFCHCAQFVQPGGSHGFDRFETLIPAILAFAEERIELPEPIALSATAL